MVEHDSFTTVKFLKIVKWNYKQLLLLLHTSTSRLSSVVCLQSFSMVGRRHRVITVRLSKRRRLLFGNSSRQSTTQQNKHTTTMEYPTAVVMLW